MPKVPETIRVGGRDFRPLCPGLCEPLAQAEYEKLRDAIRAAGRVRVAVEVTDEGGIIDGINRLMAAAELGLSLELVPQVVHRGVSQDEAERLCLEINDCRRHRSPAAREAWRKRRREEAKKMENQSSRKVAESLGVHHATAHRDRQLSGVADATPEKTPAKVTGRDGKKYASQRPLSLELQARNDKIIKMRARGFGVLEIAHEVGISNGAVSAVCRRAIEEGRLKKIRRRRDIHKEAAAEFSRQIAAKDGPRLALEAEEARKARQPALAEAIAYFRSAQGKWGGLPELSPLWKALKKIADRYGL